MAPIDYSKSDGTREKSPTYQDHTHRDEPPWLRDSRIQKQKERLEKQKQRLTARKSPRGSSRDPSDEVDDDNDDEDSHEIIFSTSTATSPSDSTSRRPISPLLEEKKDSRGGTPFSGRESTFQEERPSSSSSRRMYEQSDSSRDASLSSSVHLRKRIGQLELRQRRRIVRPSMSRSLKKNPKLLIYTDESVALDSLARFLDDRREIESFENSPSPSEMAVRAAAETLRQSFGRGRNESTDHSSNPPRTPIQSTQLNNGTMGTSGSIPSLPSRQIPTEARTPISTLGGQDESILAEYSSTFAESVRPVSTRTKSTSPRSPSEFPSLRTKSRERSEDGEEEGEAAKTSKQEVPEVDLSLHDLIDEARTTDDIAWRNALYLLSIQPNLASHVEPECQMTSLHMCCMSIAVEQPPPIWMVRCLVYTNPLQCQTEDSGGRLPLHLLAATTADVTLMQLLVEEYPASVAHTDSHGFTPLHLLLKNDQILLTLEHLRILLGETVKPMEEKETPMQFRKGDHLKASFQDLEERQRKRQEKHEQVFDVYPNDVQQTLRKITQWKRRQMNRGFYPQNQLAYVFQNPAAIATRLSRQLPLHLMVRRTFSNKIVNEIGGPKFAQRDVLVRVLIAAYPEALVATDVNGRTPLLSALLHSESLPDLALVDLLLGKKTPGFASNPNRSPAQLAGSDTLQLPLHVAAEELSDNFEILSTIAEAYPLAVQIQDIRGRTPLHCALQNYRSNPLDEDTFGLLLMAHSRNYEHVAKTVDDDGKRPLDLLIENPRALQRWEIDEGCNVLHYFMDASIDTPMNWQESRDLIDRLRLLPPWLRRLACASSHVQRSLLDELASTTNTLYVLLQGGCLVGLLILLRIALEREGVEFDSWASVNCLCVYHMLALLLRWGTAAYIGELYNLVLSNGWYWIDVAAVYCSIGVVSVLQSDVTALRESLSNEFGYFSKFIPADDYQLVATLGAGATGLLWASLVGYLVRWWCGMAVFVGSTVHLIRMLFWPFSVAVMGVVAMSQVLLTLEDCTDGNICGIADAYSTVYWIIMGEPILGVGELSVFENRISRSMIVLLIFFTLLWLFWLLSVIAMTISEAHGSDRNQIALRWFWAPKVTLTVTYRNPFDRSTTKKGAPFMERYCCFMERLWQVLSSSIKGGHLKSEIHWDAWCFRPGIIHVIRLLAVVIVPLWFCLGVITLGVLWPPQVRRWLFSTRIFAVGQQTKGALAEQLSAAKLSHLKGEIEEFQLRTVDQYHSIQEDMAQIKALLFQAMSEEVSPSRSW